VSVPPARIDASPHDDDCAMYGLRTRCMPRSRVPTPGVHPYPVDSWSQWVSRRAL
jgi:hypothetical protein